MAEFEQGEWVDSWALEQATPSVQVWKVTAALACSVVPQTFRHVAWCDRLWKEPTWLYHFTCSDLWRRIALNIREAGRGPSEPGRLQAVQAIGWWLEEANIAQVSTNLTDYDVTPIHVAYEEVCKDAATLNLPVVGSEIVGLVPLATLLQVCASQHFCTSHKFYTSRHLYFTALLYLTSLQYLTSRLLHINSITHITYTSRHFYTSHQFCTSHHFYFTSILYLTSLLLRGTSRPHITSVPHITSTSNQFYTSHHLYFTALLYLTPLQYLT